MLKRNVILIAALCALASPVSAEPKTNMLHQWATGSDAEAIAKLGEMFTAAGGKWEQTSIAGHTANTLAKLRANVVAGDAPQRSRRSTDGERRARHRRTDVGERVGDRLARALDVRPGRRVATECSPREPE